MAKVLALIIFVLGSLAFAEDFPPSPRVMWGLGVNSDYESNLGQVEPGFNLMVDVTPLEFKYSLQGAVTVSAFAGGSETSINLLLEKSFQLKKGFDVEFGLGPSVVKTSNLINTSTTVGIVTAGTLNYIFVSHWGIFVEPALRVLPRNGIELSFGATLGLTYSR